MRLNVDKKVLSTSILVMMLVVTILCLYLWVRFTRAVQFVSGLNLEVSKVSGAVFYAGQKKLFAGQRMTRTELVAHLRAINFTENGSLQQPGSYLVEGQDRLAIFPRIPEFKPVRLVFKNNIVALIAQLRLNDGQVEEAQVEETWQEPETLGSFQSLDPGQTNLGLFVRRYPVQWPEIEGSHLLYTVMAREDQTFMSHHGLSYRAICRAILSRLTGGNSGGGSTITTQVVKNVVTNNWEKSFFRKIDEVFYAAALEIRLPNKADIFTLYSNSIYMGARSGSSLYGFSAAAEEYFAKSDLRRCTLNEACVLAVLINQPNYYLEQADKNNYQPIIERRNRVLDTLHQHWPEKYPLKLIEETKKEAIRFAIRSDNRKSPLDNISEEFVTNYAAKQEALVQLIKGVRPAEIARLHFYTTLNADLMRTAESIVASRAPLLERQYPATNDCDPLPNRQRPNRMLATIVALDPRNGEILTMYGGASGKDGYQFAHAAVQSLSRPASLVKPFWQARAFERRIMLPTGELLTAGSVVNAAAYTVNGWRPDIGIGGPERMRLMMAGSRDDYAAFLVSRLGLPDAVELYERLSHRSIPNPSGTVAIGLHSGMEVSPLTVARAYAALARQGSIIEPTPFSKVYLDGQPIELASAPSQSLFSPEAVYVTLQMMRSVTGNGIDGSHGTLREAFQQAGLPVNRLALAGKTGSGPESVWAVSVSPRLVVVAWLGYLCPPRPVGQDQRTIEAFAQRTRNLTAGKTVAYLLADFLKAVGKQRPDLLEGSFEQPALVSEINIHPQTGCRFNGVGSVNEYFIHGVEPRPCEAEQ